MINRNGMEQLGIACSAIASFNRARAFGITDEDGDKPGYWLWSLLKEAELQGFFRGLNKAEEIWRQTK